MKLSNGLFNDLNCVFENIVLVYQWLLNNLNYIFLLNNGPNISSNWFCQPMPPEDSDHPQVLLG